MNEKNLTLLNKRIFVIGEDNVFLNDLEKLFQYTGVQAFIYKDISEGIDEFKKNLINLVIIEISQNSPPSDILTLGILTKLKEVGLDNIPVILVTNSEQEENLTDFNVVQTLKKEGINLLNLLSEVEKAIIIQKIESNTIDISEEKYPIHKNNEGEMRVLVVEDDPLLRNLLAIRLEKSQINCRFSHDGTNALKDIREYKPTLLILDLMLPGKDGFSVLKELREDENFSKLPVIIFSNKDSDEDRRKAKEFGVVAFLVKAMTDLSNLVKIVFDNHK